jgi:hypothetical protein
MSVLERTELEQEVRPLMRLHQLSLDIDSALVRHDWELVEEASALLPDALDACLHISSTLFQENPALLSLAQATFDRLQKCETLLQEHQESVVGDLRRLRIGQRQTQWLKSPTSVYEGRRLDTLR